MEPEGGGGINPQATHFVFKNPASPREKKRKLGGGGGLWKEKEIRETLNHASIIPNNLVLLALAQDITELLQRAADELSLLPEVGGEEAVGVDDGGEGGLEGVLEGLGGAGRGGVGVLDTGELEQTLDGGGGNKAGTTGSGNELEKRKCQVSSTFSISWAHFTHRSGFRFGMVSGEIHTRTETEPHLPDCLTGRE